MGIGTTAVSGMQAAMQNMDVISNNIANSQTPGFKKSYANFADIYPSGNGAGGAQVGAGVSLSSISQDFTAGSFTPTNQPLDIAIGNDAFFIMKDGNSGQTSYTRAGRFMQTTDGYITTLDQSRRLQGFQAVNGVVSAGGVVSDLKLESTTFPPKTSSFLNQQINLNSESTVPVNAFSPTDVTSYNFVSQGPVYDSLGNSHSVQTYYVKTAANAWTANTFVDGTSVDSSAMTFSSAGALTSSPTISVSFSPTTGATSPQAFTLNLAGTTQYANKNAYLVTPKTDGYTAGAPSGIQIDKNGNVVQQFTNGQTSIAGQIALATFQSPSGLQNIGDMSWTSSATSGDAIVNAGNSEGQILGGRLENSNVDLAQELVNLITAQHAFQANAQSEQTYSEIMQTVIQL